MANLLSLENDVFAAFLFYATVVTLKMVAMSMITSTFRLLNQEYGSPEDYATIFLPQCSEEERKKARESTELSYVERARKAHQNDLENIIPFFILGLLYVLSNPDAALAIQCFKVFTYARVAHTVVYLLKVPQPCRATAFFVGIAVNIFIGYQILMKTM